MDSRNASVAASRTKALKSAPEYPSQLALLATSSRSTLASNLGFVPF